MVGTRLVASGCMLDRLLGGSGAACAGMGRWPWSSIALCAHVAGRPVIATDHGHPGPWRIPAGLWAVLLRAAPAHSDWPLPSAPLDIRGIFVPVDKLWRGHRARWVAS